MRTSLYFAALLSAPLFLSGATLAEEMPKSEVKQAAATSPAASNQTTQTAPETAAKAKPFHRQSIFLGMLRRNNDIRRRAGLFPHRINPALTAAAQDHANYMARTGQFSHYTNGGPQSRANRYGFRGGVRENIAYGTSSVDGAFNMWQNSGAHYASIVSGTTEAGFGYAVGRGGLAYWVGVYASPARGDSIGESESAVAAALAEEAKRKEAEKNVAQEQPAGSNVVPASAEVPVEASSPAPTAANAAPPNPASNVNSTNARPANTTYYYPQNQSRRRWWRRG